MTMKRKDIKTYFITVLCIVLVLCQSMQVSARPTTKTASEVVKEITVGWNLGNSFACCNSRMQNSNISKVTYYETLWGNPVTTKQMIDKVKATGFNAVRIPVTYYNHIDEQGKIEATWLNRIAEVVDYCLDNDMYVIINMHHDTGYGKNKIMQANPNQLEAYKNYTKIVWHQVAAYFKNHDDRLMFEGFNELLDMSAQNPWYGNDKSWETMNILNQTFVDIVRYTGGKNATRNLIVSTYGAQTTYGPLSSFRMPEDTVENHLMVEVHYYGSDVKAVRGAMSEVNKYLVQKGYPVILGEFGTNRSCSMQYRVTSAANYITEAKQYGMKCFWWDDGGDYGLLNRKNCTWKYPDIVAAMMKAA